MHHGYMPEKMKDEDFFVLGWKQGGGLPGVHQTLVNYPSSNRGAFQQPCNLSLIGVCFTNPVLCLLSLCVSPTLYFL